MLCASFWGLPVWGCQDVWPRKEQPACPSVALANSICPWRPGRTKSKPGMLGLGCQTPGQARTLASFYLSRWRQDGPCECGCVPSMCSREWRLHAPLLQIQRSASRKGTAGPWSGRKTSQSVAGPASPSPGVGINSRGSQGPAPPIGRACEGKNSPTPILPLKRGRCSSVMRIPPPGSLYGSPKRGPLQPCSCLVLMLLPSDRNSNPSYHDGVVIVGR